MVEYTIPTITDIGTFAIQCVIIWILVNLGGWLVNIFKNKKIESELKYYKLIEAKNKYNSNIIKEEDDLEKPDTMAEILRRKLMKKIQPKKKEEEKLQF